METICRLPVNPVLYKGWNQVKEKNQNFGKNSVKQT